jgi:signal transduction histidine kinase
VFERFYRGDKSRPTDSGYLGLGLAIVRGILELHGRSIEFVSLPNQGTTFSFELSIAGGSGAEGRLTHAMRSRREAAG